MAPRGHDDENLLNGELARLLTKTGVPANAERRELKRRMDVVATVDGLRVVLEAETGFGAKRQAIRDADARLKQELTTLVFAVCYPDGATVDALAEATLTWTLRTRAEGSTEAREGDDPEWREGGVRALADAVRQAPGQVSDADKAAQQLSEALDGAVRRLGRETRMALARTLDLPRTRESRKEHDDGYFTAAKRGLLVVATAMLFHHRLHGRLAEAPPGWSEAWPPGEAGACADAPAVIQAHRVAWRAILAVDYRPVFETAIAALDALPVDPDREQMLRELASRVGEIAARTVGLRHDLLGRVFHRVLDTARYDGSFYTSTAAATLLAGLAIRPGDADWANPDAIASLRICDPACGTGTLLVAAAERIRALRRDAGALGEDGEARLATAMVERVLWGYDINLTATHLAASTLGMLSPETQFHTMNIHRTRLGVYDGQAYLGSLEFLEGQPRLAAWPAITAQVDTEEPEPAPPPPMDYVLMNPPFTRDSLRHDQFTAEEEQLIKAREKEMLGRYEGAARLSGSANAFLVLGEKMAGETDALAVVLPSAIATNPAAIETRRYLAARFHVDTIVGSHDPCRIFFSENTKIGEMLLVCRRWSSDAPRPPTRVVNLAVNPATAYEAGELARRLERDDADGTIQRIDAERIARGDWAAINFLSPWLVEAHRRLAAGEQGAAVCALSEIADVGPEGRRIRDSYQRSALPTLSGRRALWHHKTDVTTAMRARADSYIEPKPEKRHLADSYWEQRSALLLPHRLWLPLARVGAVMLDERVVGSIWTPCRPHDDNPETAAALCAWLDSSPGVLALLGERDNRKPSYPQFSLDALRSVPVPDFRALGDGPRDALAAAFERLKDETLAPFPQMDEDPVRRAIDEAVTEALGLDAEWVAGVRRELAREPSVTNRRWAG